jgi:hypothetical protein
MKSEEKIAFEYIKTMGFTDIVYEPNGNIPPDFLLNKHVAIEVRRLNQHYIKDGNPEAIEKLFFRLVPKLMNLLKQIKVKDFDHSVAVSIRFNRPLSLDQRLIKGISLLLNQNAGKIHDPINYQIHENLLLKFFPIQKKYDDYYVFGSSSDFDSGGLVVGLMHDAIKIAITEKQNKIEKEFDKFSEWWLILIDNIGYHLNYIDIQQLKEMPKLKHYFKKIIIVSPWNQDSCFEYN